MSSSDPSATQETTASAFTAKVVKVPKAPRQPKAPKDDTETDTQKKSSTPRAPRSKRGPARPHRRLELEVINTRIAKLEKRLTRAKSQVEDASRHVEGYVRERDFRAKEEDTPPVGADA
jgi:hypothetical protein